MIFLTARMRPREDESRHATRTRTNSAIPDTRKGQRKRQKCMHATSRMHVSSAHEHPPLVETAYRRSRATLAFYPPNSYSHNAALEARQREFDEENTRNAVDSKLIILAVNSRKQGSWFVSLSTPTPCQNIAPQLSGCACGCI